MRIDVQDQDVWSLINHYIATLAIPTDRLWVTTDRPTYSRWLGRRISGALGGAYAYRRDLGVHVVLINLARIDRSQALAVEVVVAEEFIHMRDHLDGDRRRHAKHGYDRIADRVAALTGASLSEVRSSLVPVKRRPYRFLYECPVCGAQVRRRLRGVWSCGRCSPRYDPTRELVLLGELASPLPER